MAVLFGPFVLNLDTRQLLRDGTEVHLSPKAFELLAILVKRRPAALSKAALQEHLWPETFVAEANLPNLIGEIRAALGDDPRSPTFIRTVSRFGYAFSSTDWPAPAPEEPRLEFRLERDGRQQLLTDGENLIGRSTRRIVVRFDLHLAPPRAHHRQWRDRQRRGSREQERHVRRRGEDHRRDAARQRCPNPVRVGLRDIQNRTAGRFDNDRR